MQGKTMFLVVALIGIYSYLIFFLGLLGLLYKSNLIFVTVVFLVCFILLTRSILLYSSILLVNFRRKIITTGLVKMVAKNKLAFVLVILFFFQVAVNLVGAFDPELAFDALWYHLTIPKIYLLNHKIFYIPGGLLYYSVMPKLTEMLYIAALSLGNEITAKLIHFFFGLLTCFALYKLSRKFFDKIISLMVVLIFYSNLIVDWQSITAYVDLARTFFETMALWAFINWWEDRDIKWLIRSSMLVGLASAVKLLSFVSFLIFSILILFSRFFPKRTRGLGIMGLVQIYWYIGILVVSPWLIFAFINTGNPVYPFFSNVYKVGINLGLLNPFNFIKEVWLMFTRSSDPVSPVYIAFLPLIVYFFRQFKTTIKIIILYSFLAIVIWYFTPRTGGGRFIMPYLPAFSLVVGAVLKELFLKKNDFVLRMFVISFIFIISLISILYRTFANYKYVPVVLGRETKQMFLVKNLNFSFGDFYDTNKDIKHIVKNNNVLLYGFHNLYYVDFPFIDSSWVKDGDSFSYIAVQNDDLPGIYLSWKKIYYNRITHVALYKKPIRK